MSAEPIALQASTLGDAIREAADALKRVGIESAMLDARLLLLQAANVSLEAYLAEPSQMLSVRTKAAAEMALARRVRREPIAHILGYREFFGRRFRTGPQALVPRPESEGLIEAALAQTERNAPLRVLDLGTGTGCLLATVLAERPLAEGLGVDRSEQAIGLAKENARQLGVAERAAFVVADWAAPFAGGFDLVLANPPYIPHDLLTGLEPDVRDYDPPLALDGGPDGLDAYRAIAGSMPRILAPGGIAVFELGVEIAQNVPEILSGHALAVDPIRVDLAGLPRVLCARKRV